MVLSRPAGGSSEDKKDIYAEAKGQGFDVKIPARASR